MNDISVIIPVYNRADLITRALDSVVAQTRAPERVIVVDNNSTDRTPEVLAEYQQRDLPFELVVVRETKPGAACARNRGIREINTRYVLFFDSDDTIPRDHIERTLAQFAHPSDPDLVSWRGRIIYADGSSILTRLPHGDVMTSQLIHSSFATSLMAMKTDLIRKAGLWDEELPVWDDYEWSTRLLLAEPVVHSEDRIGGNFYLQEVSLTGTDFSSKKGQWELSLDAVERDLKRSPNPARKKWLRWIAYRRVDLRAHYAREGDSSSRPEATGHAASVPPASYPTEAVAKLPPLHRLALRAIYSYTRRGGRGAYYLYRLVNGW